MTLDTAKLLRWVGLAGLAASVACWGLLEARSPGRTMLLRISQLAALAFALIYIAGAFAAADSGARRILPSFP